METDPDGRDTAAAPTPTRRGQQGHRRVWIGAAAVVALGLAVFVLVWFEPQKLFIDERVEQAVPTAGPTTTTADQDQAVSPAESSESSVTTTVPPEPVDLRTGSFVSLDHTTTGTVRVLALADGRRFGRLEGFATDNGPDLFVYLSTNPADGPEGAFDDYYANLGQLQGTSASRTTSSRPMSTPRATPAW
jgi:Electron transfer DM13